jgi:hypothetical protein
MLVSAYKKGSKTTTFGFILLPTLATFTLILCHNFSKICDTFVHIYVHKTVQNDKTNPFCRLPYCIIFLCKRYV